MILEFPERLQRAIRIRAAKSGQGPSEVARRILERELQSELREADEAIEAEGQGSPPSKPRKTKG